MASWLQWFINRDFVGLYNVLFSGIKDFWFVILWQFTHKDSTKSY